MEKKMKTIMIFVLVINVIDSRPPERQATGMPHARAKNIKKICFCGNIEDMKQFLYDIYCKKKKIEYDNICGEDISE